MKADKSCTICVLMFVFIVLYLCNACEQNETLRKIEYDLYEIRLNTNQDYGQDKEFSKRLLTDGA